MQLLQRGIITLPRYADWKAPAEDGQVIVWPDAPELLLQSEANHALLSSFTAPIQGMPLGELRRRQRLALGHADQLLLATGHQTELYHPGVWVKDVLIDRMARRLGGRAVHFAVDTDSPKHVHLRWPEGVEGAAVRTVSQAMTDDARLNAAAWAGLVAGPTAEHVGEVRRAFDEASTGWGFKPMVDRFLDALASGAVQQSLPAALTAATQQVNSMLGVETERVLASAMWGMEPYLVFVHHLLARAEQFAGHYNRCLQEYRVEQGISSPGRPMPDLAVAGDAVEAPFWLDDLGGLTRKRLTVSWKQGEWALDDFVFDPQADAETVAARLGEWLASRRLRIAPRALTLTMFLRLLVADQFVHGIGGGRYDQVTDRIIHAHFGIEPPRFSVTTATMYFPAALGHARVNLHPLTQEGRRLRHGSFWAPKRELAQRIAGEPRRSQRRRELYFEMHHLLAEQAKSPRMREWGQRLEEAMAEQARQKTLFDRELFFAIQPEGRLRAMISRYDGA